MRKTGFRPDKEKDKEKEKEKCGSYDEEREEMLSWESSARAAERALPDGNPMRRVNVMRAAFQRWHYDATRLFMKQVHDAVNGVTFKLGCNIQLECYLLQKSFYAVCFLSHLVCFMQNCRITHCMSTTRSVK